MVRDSVSFHTYFVHGSLVLYSRSVLSCNQYNLVCVAGLSDHSGHELAQASAGPCSEGLPCTVQVWGTRLDIELDLISD